MTNFKLNYLSSAAAIAIAMFAANGAQSALVPVNFTVTSSATSPLPLSPNFQTAVQNQFGGSAVDRITGQFQYDPGAPVIGAFTTTNAFGDTTSEGNLYALNSFSISFFSGSQLLFSESVRPQGGSAITVSQRTNPTQADPSSVSVNIKNSFDNMLFNGAALKSVLLTLTDSTGSIITSPDLPTNAIWEGLPTNLRISTVLGSGQTALTQTLNAPVGNLAVPEPAPLALIATGLLALGFAVRRNRNS